MENQKHFDFGHIREIPKDAAESRIIPFILSTPARDRHKTVLNQENWLLDNYRKNPIVAYQHNLFGDMCNPADPNDVIGKSSNVNVETLNGVKSLTGSVEFEPADINQKAEQIFRKVLFGSISSASVGFVPIGEGWYGERDQDQGNENETYYFAGQELLEWSVVNIPSNPEAGKRKVGYMRDHVAAALSYASRALNMRFSKLETLRICDILDLLEGRDIGEKTEDPEKARAAIRAAADARMRMLKLNSH